MYIVEANPRNFLLSVAVLTAAFALVGIVLNVFGPFGIELSLDSYLYGLSPSLIDLSVIADRACGNGPLIVIIAILLIRRDTRKLGGVMLLMLIVELFLLETLLKNIVDRPRPWEVLDVVQYVHPNGGSYPSGHTSQMFLFSGFLFARWKRFSAAFMCVGVFTAFTRLVLCAHYISDVVCGAAFGFLLGAIFYYYMGRGRYPETPRQVVIPEVR